MIPLIHPVIAAVGTAVPPFALTQKHAEELMVQHYRDELSSRSIEVLRQVLRHKSVNTRYASVNSLEELLGIKNEDPDRRIERFTGWAVRLSAEALQRALDRAGLTIDAITAVIVNTCTGYICPGIATYLMEKMGIGHTVPVYDLVGSGCGGAVPNIQLGERLARGNPGSVVACIAVEISTATFEMDNDIGLIVSNAIFGDGAAAAIITNREHGCTLEATASAFFPEAREYVRFEYCKGRLRNKLDPQLPKVIRQTVPPFIHGLCGQKGISADDVRYWALHPGGDRILTAIQEELKLSDGAMSVSRGVLFNYGNMSSPTVLFALEKLLADGMEKGAWCVMAAYGAGMSIHGYLLRNG